jgi:hypothetical protein
MKVEATQARNTFAEMVNRVRYGADRVIIQRRGKLLEDRLDIEAARRALADPRNRARIPWARVKAALKR